MSEQDMPEPAGDDFEEAEVEEGDCDPPVADALMSGQAYFYQGLEEFCRQHECKVVQVDSEDQIWLFPDSGGEPVNLAKWGKKAALRSIN